MAKKNKNKKKHPIVPKRKERLKLARGWLKPFLASNEAITSADVIKSYREKFRVDVATALRELEELGYSFKDGFVDRALRAEEIRIEQKWMQKTGKSGDDFFSDFQDDRFAFIAGYTSGGAPYGITWEESEGMGFRPYEDELADELQELEDELAEIEANEEGA
jgi:hypothetical protein